MTITTWIEIGNRNPCIADSCDPPFNEKSFKETKTINELYEELTRYMWSSGTAFYMGNFCLINQIDGGNEWMVMKDDFAFESLTVTTLPAFEKFWNNITSATNKQLKELTYSR